MNTPAVEPEVQIVPPTDRLVIQTAEELKEEADSLAVSMESIVVADQATYDFGYEKCKEFSEMRKRADLGIVGQAKRLADAFHSRFCGYEKNAFKRAAAADKALRAAMATWMAADSRRARDEQAKLDEQHRKEQAAEQEKVRKASLKQGATKAEANEAAAAVTTPRPMMFNMPQKKGAAPKKWKGEVTSKRSLVKAALEDDTLMALIEIDQAGVNRLAALIQGSGTKPGLRFYSEFNQQIR